MLLVSLNIIISIKHMHYVTGILIITKHPYYNDDVTGIFFINKPPYTLIIMM